MSRATAIGEKLEAARAVRASLDPEIAQAALEAAEGVRGADKRLADLRARVASVDRDVSEATLAYDLARQLDRRAEIAGRAQMRETQLADFAGHARGRDAAVDEMCGAIETFAKAFARYVNLTLKLTGALPLGTSMPQLGMGPNNAFGSALGDLSSLMAAEAFRHVDMSSPVRAALPFAKAPTLGLANNPAAVPPASDAFKEATAAMLGEVSAQVARLNSEDATALGTKEAA